MKKKSESWEKEIREIATYHSDDGTSGYCLSEEQFNRIFDIVKQARREGIEEAIKEMEKFTASGEYLSDGEFKRGYDARDKELLRKISELKKKEGGK